MDGASSRAGSGQASDGVAVTTASYVRMRQVASGGMGTVYLARRREGGFQRLYAVKRLHPHLRDDPDFRAMFVEEARLAGLITHPNVVGVLDVGEDHEGPFLVMDFVQGLPLSQLITLANRSEAPLAVQSCVRIALAVARGLHASHELRDHEGRALQLVHRDLSPQNVLIGWDGTVRITDFGIAKALGRSTKTATGVVKGKFAYMAPEQLRFEPVDRRTDLFALGILLFEMLAGRRLYKDDDESSGVQRILREPPPDIGEERPEVPPTLVALLFSLLAKSPDQRPSTAAEVAQRLEATLAELLADEPAIEVGDVLEELAGPTRERWEAELRQTLAKADEVPEIPASNTPPRSRLPRVAAFAGLVAVGFVAAFALAPDDVPAPVPSAAPPSVAPVATVQQPVEDDAPTVPPSVDEPAPTTRASSSNEASDDPHPPTMEPAAPTTEPEGVTTTSERTRPRRRRPRRAATATTTTTMWEEWE